MIFAAGLIALLVMFISSKVKKEPAASTDKRPQAYSLMLLCGVILNFGLWLFYAYAMDFQRQGRYVLPSALALFACVCSGYDKIKLPEKLSEFEKFKAPVIVGIIALLVILCLYFIFMKAIPAYADFSLLA